MKKQKTDLTNLINIGPKIAERIEELGIKTSDDFLSRDPFEVFNEMQKRDPSLCRCALASIVGASTGITWHKIHKKAAGEFDKRYPGHEWRGRC